MISKYATLIILLNSFFCFSQESKIDSLKKLKKADKFITNNLIAWEFAKTNPDSLLHYNNISKKYIKLENQKGEFHALNSAYYLLIQDFEKSKKEGKKAIEIAVKISDNKILGSVYGNLSTIARFEGNYKECKKNLDLSLKYRILTKDNSQISNTFKNFGAYYATINDNANAIKYFEKSLNLLTKKSNNTEKLTILMNIGYTYTNMDEMSKSIEYFEKCELILKKINFNSKFTPSVYLNWGNALMKLNRNKEAEEKLLIGLKYDCEPSELAGFYVNLANIYVNQKKYNLAKTFIEKAIKIDSQLNYKNGIASDYSILGLIEQKGNKDYKLANDHFKKSLDLYTETQDSINIQMAYENLIKNKLSTNNDSLTISYFDNWIKLKNSLTEKQKIKSLYELDSKYQTSQKEAKIKTQQLQIQKEKTNKNFALAGIVFISLLTFGGFWLYRIKQKQKEISTQNTLLTLQQNLTAMQLDNLNKQLDPHEIKNILANISTEIQRNAPDAYNKMTKLLNLTRASLSSNSITDSIENQLQQIEDYLSLEKSVLPVPLNYSINNTVDTSKQIPRLLLKNLVENAIKHGIKNKKEGGEININLSIKENAISISVDDTGIGRQQSISLDSGIGTSTYINLFETLNKTNTQKASFNIIDKQKGTTVKIVIPNNYIYS